MMQNKAKAWAVRKGAREAVPAYKSMGALRTQGTQGLQSSISRRTFHRIFHICFAFFLGRPAITYPPPPPPLQCIYCCSWIKNYK